MEVRIAIDDAAVRRGFERFPRQMVAALDPAIERGAYEIASAARRTISHKDSTGALKDSINREKIVDLHWRVATGTNYARPVEEGRAPGKMPGTAKGLLEWVKQKTGLDGKNLDRTAFLIARAIGRKGIKPAPYMQPAFEDQKERIVANVQAAARKAAQEFGRV